MPQNVFQSPQGIYTTDYSLTVGVSAVTAFKKFTGALHFMRIWNLHASNVLWCSRTGTAAVSTIGSFPIQPGTYELWVAPGPVPGNALSLIATGASTPVTIEIG